MGLSPKSRSAYLPLDSGKRQPTSQEAEALAAVYGWPPESPTEALDATETPDSVLAAVKLLLNEIQAERAARVEWERGLLSALRELATGKAPRDDHERELRAAAGR